MRFIHSHHELQFVCGNIIPGFVGSFSKDPLAYKGRTIPEYRSSRFASSQESDCLSTHNRYFLQVQHDSPSLLLQQAGKVQYVLERIRPLNTNVAQSDSSNFP